MKQFLSRISIAFIGLLILSGCKKGWLDAKSNQQLVIPSSIADCQAILDNSNGIFNGFQPTLGEEGADNYYLLYSSWQTVAPIYDQNAYIWASDLYEGNSCSDWNYPYQQVFYANNALSTINTITPDASTMSEWNNVKGEALYLRAYALYNVASLFAKQYALASASTDLGIPLKLSADINDNPGRGTLQQTYAQITGDLIQASQLLPVTQAYLTRPSKPAAFAMLARIYLSMENYDTAFLYADSSLQLYNYLQDFNALNASSSLPIAQFNPETIFFSELRLANIIRETNAIVDSSLYSSYSPTDLRKGIYFILSGGYFRVRPAYTGTTLRFFGGLATDEIYLIRAECSARKGNTSSAMADLNTLLSTRWKTGTFVPFTAANAQDALNQILTERRKELIFRGLRWTDLKRLNNEGYNITLTRILNGQTYTLPPNSPLYVLPIPPDEIQASGIKQNPR